MTITSYAQLKQCSEKLPVNLTAQSDTKTAQLIRLREIFREQYRTPMGHSSSCPNFKNQTKQKLDKRKVKNHFPELFIKGSNYKATRMLGTGAYSMVCEAIDLRSNTTVAIKKISKVFNNSKEAIRTLREIKLLHHFAHHKNILGIREVMLPRHANKFQNLLIVLDKMEYDLAEKIERSGRLPRSERQQIIYKIIHGLHQIHSSNVIHRDLRPKNILLNNNDNDVVICDFGMGRSIGMNLSLLSFTTATLYTPPEGLFGQPQYGKGVDVWAIGCIFAEMITGDRLVRGQSSNDVIKFVFQLVGIPTIAQIDQLIADPAKNQLAKSIRADLLSSSLPLPLHCPTSNNPLFNSNDDLKADHHLAGQKPFSSFFKPNIDDDKDDDERYKVDADELDLLRKIFCFSPADRISTADLLSHPYFDHLKYQNDNSAVAQPIELFEYDDAELNNLSTPQLQKVVYDRLLQLFPQSVYAI